MVTAVSADARRVLGQAFDEAKTAFSPEHSEGFSSVDLQDVYKASLRIDDELASKRRIRNLRRLRPFFEGLERYSKVIEPLRNGTPFLPWIWVLLL